jgi:outer membrane protein
MIPRTAAAAAALAVFAAAQSAWAAAPAPMPAPSPAPSASTIPMALTLAQAESIALASSPTLALARGQLNASAGGIGVARSGELPNISVSGADQWSHSTTPAGSFGSGSPAINNAATVRSASATLRQLIIDGGRIRASVAAAKFSTDAARLNLERQVQSLDFNVASAYYAALQARHQLQVARDSLNLAQVQENLVNAQYKAGVASHADVITAQLPVAQAQLAVVQAINGEQTQIALMLDTMGLPAQTPVIIADETAAPINLPSLDVVLGVANRQRPDLLAAQASSDAAAAGLRSAHLGNFPTISGSASGSTTSTNSTQGSSGGYSPAHSAGLTLSIPIFDGGLTRAETAVAQGQFDEATANLKAAQLLVSLNIEQAYLGIETAQAGLTAANAEYSQARTVLDVTNAQYKSGVTTLPLLLSAQTGLAKAESDQVNALYTYKTAWQQLLLSEGTIGQ